MPTEDYRQVAGSERWHDLRSTWVDLTNERETRSSEVLEAWRDQDFDLVPNRDPVPLPDDVAAGVCPDVEMFAFAIRPDWLANSDGTLSYMDLVFRSAEYKLWRLQRDHVLEEHVTGNQLTLEAVTDGGQPAGDTERLPEAVEEARAVGGTARCDCGFSVRFVGDESREEACEKWHSEEHRRAEVIAEHADRLDDVMGGDWNV